MNHTLYFKNEDAFKRAQAKAKREGRNISEVVNDCIEQYASPTTRLTAFNRLVTLTASAFNVDTEKAFNLVIKMLAE